jgi:tRNA(fMet)-specific endonuclease VapC
VRYVLDTNIAVAALKGHAGVLARLAGVQARDVGLPALVIGELTFGALRSARPEANLDEFDACGRAFLFSPLATPWSSGTRAYAPS